MLYCHGVAMMLSSVCDRCKDAMPLNKARLETRVFQTAFEK